jgi:hypothetical protein
MGRLGRVAATLRGQILRVTKQLALEYQCSQDKVGELTTPEGGANDLTLRA